MKNLWVVLLLFSITSACAKLPQVVLGNDSEVTSPVDAAPDTLPQQDEIKVTEAPEEPTVMETQLPMADLDDEKFDIALAEALENRNFENLRSMMRDRFLIGNWQANLMEYPSEEALQRLQETVFAQGAKPVTHFETDVPALLSGTDPLSLWGPVSNPVRALHVNGLGADTNKEVVIVIGRDDALGQLFWLGILLPRGDDFSVLLPDSAEVVKTDVEAIAASTILNVRLGPGIDYVVVGQIQVGEIAQVTGISVDRAWWRIFCTFDASGICWVSASPDLSEPVPLP